MSQATDMLSHYLAMEAAIEDGQSCRWGDRVLTRADLGEIRKGRQEWEARVAQETRTLAGGYGPRYMVPDFSK